MKILTHGRPSQASSPAASAQSQPRSWGVDAFIGVLLASTATLLAALSQRGLSLWALWQLQSAERFEAWLDAPSAETMAHAFDGGPQVPWSVSYLAAKFWGGDELLPALTFMAAIATGLCVGVTYLLGRDAAGRFGGAIAALGLMMVPRFWAAATVPGPTIFVLASVLLAAYALHRVRRSPLWVPVVLIACFAAFATSLHGWLLLLPAGYLLLVDGDTPVLGGHVKVPSLSLGGLLAVLFAAAAFYKLVPWFGEEGFERFGQYLGVWLRVPPEPFLYAGEQFGPRRLPLWAPLVLWARTLPATLLLPIIAGATLGSPLGTWLRRRIQVPPSLARPPGDGIRVASVFAAWFAFEVLLLRTPNFALGDTLLLAIPFFCVMGAWALTLLASWVAEVTRGPGSPIWAAPAFVTVLFVVPMALETSASIGRYESYYNGLTGGTASAVDAGFSRYAHAPLPYQLLADTLSADGSDRLSVLTSEWEVVPVLERYVQMGWVPPHTRVSPAEANVWLFVYDDNLREVYDRITEFRRLDVALSGGDESGAGGSTWLLAGDVPLVGILRE